MRIFGSILIVLNAGSALLPAQFGPCMEPGKTACSIVTANIKRQNIPFLELS